MRHFLCTLTSSILQRRHVPVTINSVIKDPFEDGDDLVAKPSPPVTVVYYPATYATYTAPGSGGIWKGYSYGETCSHRGKPVQVGPYVIHAGGVSALTFEDMEGMDVVIPLEQKLPAKIGQVFTVMPCPWVDHQGPPPGFREFLLDQVIPVLAEGKKVIVYCIGSHGRTGTFLASLIALLEPEIEDPIAAVRERHCQKAIESRAQAEYIFALKGEELPDIYDKQFPSFVAKAKKLVKRVKAAVGKTPTQPKRSRRRGRYRNS